MGIKITEVPTMTSGELDKVIQLLNHGEKPERIAEVEGFDVDMIRCIASLYEAKLMQKRGQIH